MKKAIVFGGSGFLGSHVADKLTAEGYEVTIFDMRESVHRLDQQKFVKGDISNLDDVQTAIAGQDVVYHFAGISDIDEAYDSPLKTVEANILGTVHILEGCQKNKVERFVFASSVYVYSESGAFYRSSKQSCELLIEDYHKKYGFDFTVLRYGSLYGPRSDRRNSVYRFIEEALQTGKIARLSNGEEMREYIHVYDAAHLSVKALNDKFKNQYFILTGYQQTKVKDLMSMIKEMLGNKVELTFTDHPQKEHYQVTPYNFSPRMAKKLMDSSHVELGQGVLDLINVVHTQQEIKA